MPGESFRREWTWQARLAPECCLPDPWWDPDGTGHSSLEQNAVLAAQMVARLGTGRRLTTAAFWDGTTALVSAGPSGEGRGMWRVGPGWKIHQPLFARFRADLKSPRYLKDTHRAVHGDTCLQP